MKIENNLINLKVNFELLDSILMRFDKLIDDNNYRQYMSDKDGNTIQTTINLLYELFNSVYYFNCNDRCSECSNPILLEIIEISKLIKELSETNFNMKKLVDNVFYKYEADDYENGKTGFRSIQTKELNDSILEILDAIGDYKYFLNTQADMHTKHEGRGFREYYSVDFQDFLKINQERYWTETIQKQFKNELYFSSTNMEKILKDLNKLSDSDCVKYAKRKS